jgi:hypothetical protein
LAISSKGKGRSGGARVITCVKITSAKVFLLSIYDKTQKEDISDKELNELLKFIYNRKSRSNAAFLLRIFNNPIYSV